MKTHGFPCFALNSSGEIPSCREKHMQAKSSWRQSLMLLLAFILSLGGVNLAGCDFSIGTSDSAGDEEGEEPDPPDEPEDPTVPTSGASNQPEDPTEEPTPTTTVEPEDPSTTTGSEPETTTGTETGEPEPACGNNGLPRELQGVLESPICLEDIPEVEEGWEYSAEESEIQGEDCHKATDVKAKTGQGTEIRNMIGGYCLATFESTPAPNTRGQKIGFGGGLLVVCWAPEINMFIQYLHLSGLGKNIPYYTPSVDDPNESLPSFYPSVIVHPSKEFIQYAVYIPVGEMIGLMGCSGLSVDGYDPPSMNPQNNGCWDGMHVHIQIHGDRIWDPQLMLWKRPPDQIYDMFGLYSNFSAYVNAFVLCSAMMICDVDDELVYPVQCDGVPANGAEYKQELLLLDRPELTPPPLQFKPLGRDYTLSPEATLPGEWKMIMRG